MRDPNQDNVFEDHFTWATEDLEARTQDRMIAKGWRFWTPGTTTYLTKVRDPSGYVRKDIMCDPSLEELVGLDFDYQFDLALKRITNAAKQKLHRILNPGVIVIQVGDVVFRSNKGYTITWEGDEPIGVVPAPVWQSKAEFGVPVNVVHIGAPFPMAVSDSDWIDKEGQHRRLDHGQTP